jgi:peptidoglycan hydrolase-like protein with peptidoglycan-binding domain
MTSAIRTAKTPPPLVRSLKTGMKGDDVKYVQTILQRQGYFKGTPLGNFFSLTEEAVKYFQNTHIKEDGKFLEVTGEVDVHTWWALHNAHGPAQRNFVDPKPVVAVGMRVDGPRHKFLDKLYAMHAKGIKEIPDGSNYGDGVTAICNACGFYYGIYWCLAALSYAFKEATGEKPLGAMHVGCSTFWNEALDKGVAHLKENYTPTPGDIAIYNYSNVRPKNGRLSGAGHAAAVMKVNTSGTQFNAIEGNIGNRLKFSVRDVAEASLVGFVNPFMDADALPKFARGLDKAPVIKASYASTR